MIIMIIIIIIIHPSIHQVFKSFQYSNSLLQPPGERFRGLGRFGHSRVYRLSCLGHVRAIEGSFEFACTCVRHCFATVTTFIGIVQYYASYIVWRSTHTYIHTYISPSYPVTSGGICLQQVTALKYVLISTVSSSCSQSYPIQWVE